MMNLFHAPLDVRIREICVLFRHLAELFLALLPESSYESHGWFLILSEVTMRDEVNSMRRGRQKCFPSLYSA